MSLDEEAPKALALATAIRTEVAALTIADDAMAEKLNQMLRDAKARAAELEERRTNATKPLNKALKEINSWFKPSLEALGSLEQLIKAKITEYQNRRRLEAQASMEAVEREARQGGTPEGLTAALEKIVEPPAPLAGFSSREVWTAEVVDAAKVPREYCSPDPKLVRALADEAPELSDEDVVAVERTMGIRLYKKTISTSRA